MMMTSIHHSKFDDFEDLVYPIYIELEIKDTQIQLGLDLHLETDREGRSKMKLQDKRDDFHSSLYVATFQKEAPA